MKLRNYFGLSLRLYFGINLFVYPFLDFFLFIVLELFDINTVVCGTIFIILFIVIGVKIYSIKCPECNTKLIETYRVGSKYYQGVFHKVPEKCPCCGIALDEV